MHERRVAAIRPSWNARVKTIRPASESFHFISQHRRGARMRLTQATAPLAMAFIFLLFFFSSSGAFAQRTPQAAPTGPGVQTEQLGTPQAAPTTPVDVTQTGNTIGPGFTNISIYSLFMRADPIVKTVMAILALASH